MIKIKHFSSYVLFALVIISNVNVLGQTINISETNMLLKVSKSNLNGLSWLNKPDLYSLKNGILNVTVSKGTDFFNNPASKEVNASAPLLFKEVASNFVAIAVVKPDFSSMWNAASIMVYQDSLHWIKFAFENSDATGKSIVSVITNDRSDDANGVVLDDYDKIWLRMVRKGNVYSMQWSVDGIKYKMARIGMLPPVNKVKVGIEAQCPAGEHASHKILYFNIENKTVENIRTGE